GPQLLDRLRQHGGGGAELDGQLARLDPDTARAQGGRGRAHRLPRLVRERPVEGAEAGQQDLGRHDPCRTMLEMRTIDRSRSSASVIRTSWLKRRRPACSTCARAKTVPSVIDRRCVALRSTPTTAPPTRIAACMDARVSAMTTCPPPWNRPAGWRLPSTAHAPS